MFVEIDGHDMAEIVDTLDATDVKGQPTVIIANTAKGKGISCAENGLVFIMVVSQKNNTLKLSKN